MSHPDSTQCVWSAEQFLAYLAEELEPAEMVELEAHLATCPVCESRLDDCQQPVPALRALPRLPCPERVLAMVERQTRQPRPGPAWWARLAAAALVAVGLGLAVARFAGTASTAEGKRPVNPADQGQQSAVASAPSISDVQKIETQVLETVVVLRAVSERTAHLAASEVLEHGTRGWQRQLGLVFPRARSESRPTPNSLITP